MKRLCITAIAATAAVVFTSCGNFQDSTRAEADKKVTIPTEVTTQTTPLSSSESKTQTTTVSSATTATKTTPVPIRTDLGTTTTKKPAPIRTDLGTTTTKVTTSAKPENTTPIVPSNIEESEAVDSSYFDDAIFIGDSVSNMLKIYCTDGNGKKPLGNATFFTAGSFCWTNSKWSLDNKNSVHPTLNGKKMKIPDAVYSSGATKVYIMLGMNDLAGFDTKKALGIMEDTLSEITENRPEIKIYIQSVTPMLPEKERKTLNNESIHAFNKKLKEICDNYGYTYLDLNSVMGGKSLKREYCGDPNGMGLHFNSNACKVWIDYLKTHTAE